MAAFLRSPPQSLVTSTLTVSSGESSRGNFGYSSCAVLDTLAVSGGVSGFPEVIMVVDLQTPRQSLAVSTLTVSGGVLWTGLVYRSHRASRMLLSLPCASMRLQFHAAYRRIVRAVFYIGKNQLLTAVSGGGPRATGASIRPS